MLCTGKPERGTQLNCKQLRDVVVEKEYAILQVEVVVAMALLLVVVIVVSLYK
jgi:hypothetical protein